MSDNIKRVPLKDLSTFEGRAKHLYYIQDKDGVKRPFQFLQAQRYFNDIVEEEFKRTKREIGAAQCRIIALKPRQVGWTTFSEIKSLDMQLWDEGNNGVIVAHDNDTTEKVYWIYQRAYNNLPEKIIPTVDGKDLTSRELYEHSLSKQQQQQLFNNEDVTSEELDNIHTIDIKPKTRSYTGKRIGFEGTDSVTTIFTAGKGDAGGLGGTARRIHLCLSEDSKVILSNGEAKPIKNIEIGDKVVTSDGKEKPVKNKFNTGEKETYEIETWLSDDSISASKNHKVLTDNGWKKVNDLSKDDYVRLPTIKPSNEITEYSYDLDSRSDIRWTTTKGIKKYTFKLNYDFGYLVGYYLAEGHVKYEKSKDIYSSVVFASHKDENYKEKVIRDFGYLATSVDVSYRKNNRKITTFYGVFLANVLQEICGRTTGKHIPSWFFKTNKKFIEGVVVGYLAGDGSKTKNVIDNKYNGYENWKPEHSAETIYNFLKEREKILNKQSIKDLDNKYGISESTGGRWVNVYSNKTAEEIGLGDKSQIILNYISERSNTPNKKKKLKALREKYGITKATISDWHKKYEGKSLDYIRNNYGGRLANVKQRKTYNYICATSICEKITRQLRRLIVALDIGVPSVKFNQNVFRYDVKVKDYYNLMVSGKPAEHLIDKIDGVEVSENGSEGKNVKWKKIDGSYYVKIKNIKKDKKKQTYDIEVDHETHDFETPIGIVSNSECGNYDYFSDLMTSLNPSVPKFADNVFFILESTANGMTGQGEGFYNKWTTVSKEWEKYQKGEQQTFFNFRPVFIPWYMIDEYELPLTGGKYEDISQIDFGSPEEKQKFLQREKEMMVEGVWNPLTKERQVLTPEKINWYRFIIKTDCEHDYKEAQRFYPTTPEDAFVASSNSFFDSTKLNEVKGYYLNNGEPEYDLGNLEWDDDNELTFVKDSIGSLKIFKYPEPNWENRYVIGADIARGYEDGDYSVAFVKDRLNQEYVALWFGKIDQDKFAETLTELGIYYNEALLVPEANLETVVELIKPDGRIPYIGEIYYREGGNQMRYGYWTDVSSRRTLMDEHKAWLRDNDNGYYALPDIATIDEHVSFVKKKTPNGVKYEADEGCHDDRTISAALANKGDYWWDEDPEEYKPTKVMEFIRRPIKDRKKRKRQSQLGK